MKKLAVLLVFMSLFASCAHKHGHAGCKDMEKCKAAGCMESGKASCGTGEHKCADSKCAEHKN